MRSMVPEPAAVFVYGTLLPGHLRWAVLARHATGWEPASAPGLLFDTGEGWPAARLGPGAASEDPGAAVPGARVRIDPPALGPLLAELDEIEEVPDLYERLVVTTTAGPAWAWSWVRSPEGLTRIDRWDDQPEA